VPYQWNTDFGLTPTAPTEPQLPKGVSVEQLVVRLVSDGKTLAQIQKDLQDRGISAGSPFEDGSSKTALNWVWVDHLFTAADTATVVAHNMNVPLRSDGGQSIRFLVAFLQHDGFGINAASTLSLNFDSRDLGLVTPNDMPLRLYVGGTRTVSGAHPVTASLVFIPV
jgi:hypothetical protein